MKPLEVCPTSGGQFIPGAIRMAMASKTACFAMWTDILEGIVRLIFDFSGPVNVGNPAELTILELAGKVLQLVGGR